MSWDLIRVAEVAGGRLLGENAPVLGFSTDTRQLKPGELFVALKGKRDGTMFAAQAIERGAAGVLVSRDVGVRPAVLVEDTLRALWDLAREARREFRGEVIGITGTVGKTSLKEMLAAVLGVRFRVHRSPKSFNNQIGLPLTILGAEGADVLIAEVGVNHRGEMAPLAELLKPTVAVVTSVGPGHLEGLGSTEGVAQEKSELFKGARVGVIPKWVERREVFLEVFEGEVLLEPELGEAWLEEGGVRFEAGGAELFIPVPHPGLAQLGAIAWELGRLFGLGGREIAEALANFRMPEMRFQLLKVGDWEVVNDAYNSNPLSLKALLGAVKPEGTLLVLGDMLELGPEAENWHREAGRWVAERGFKALVAVGPLMGFAAAEAEKRGVQVWRFQDADAAARELPQIARGFKRVVLKGSRAMALEKLLEVLRAG